MPRITTALGQRSFWWHRSVDRPEGVRKQTSKKPQPASYRLGGLHAKKTPKQPNWDNQLSVRGWRSQSLRLFGCVRMAVLNGKQRPDADFNHRVPHSSQLVIISWAFATSYYAVVTNVSSLFINVVQLILTDTHCWNKRHDLTRTA